MSPITTGIRVPPRSRKFTEQDAREAHAALLAYQSAGNEEEGVGYGTFDSAEAARSAGQSLNHMIAQLGLRTTKWATAVFKTTVEVPTLGEDGEPVPVVDGDGNAVTNEDGTPKVQVNKVDKWVGLMLAKDAKPAPPRKAAAKGGKGKGK